MSYASYLSWFLSYFNYNSPQLAYQPGKFYKPWQVAVAVPIPNYRFVYPKRFSFGVYSNCGVGTTNPKSFEVDMGDADSLQKMKNIIASNVFVMITKNTTKIGEIVRLDGAYTTAVNRINLTVRDNIVGYYDGTNSNTTVEFYSPQIAEKWDITNSTVITPLGMVKGYPTDLVNIDGDLFGQQLALTITTADATGREFYCYIPNLQEYASDLNTYKYRVGMRYYMKYTDATNAIANMQIKLPGCTAPAKLSFRYYDATNTNRYYIVNSAIFSDWKTFDTIRNDVTQQKLIISFAGDTTASVVTPHINFGIDEIYLEHSGGMELDLGCILMTSPPIRGSLVIGTMTDDSLKDMITLTNNDKYLAFPMGSPNKALKYTLKATFEDVDFGLYQKMKTLERFQNDGFKINIHPNLPELPEVLTGYLKVYEPHKDVFDFKKNTFDLEFQEA